LLENEIQLGLTLYKSHFRLLRQTADTAVKNNGFYTEPLAVTLKNGSA